ncbi:hypothetical protein AAA501_11755 [Pseudomonas aeruginosa]
MVGFEARTQQGAALRPTSHFVYESIYTAILELQGFVRGLVARASLDIALNKGAVYTAEACAAQRALLDALEDGDSAAAAALMDAYLRGLFARMRFLPPPTTDLREAFGMKAPRGEKRRRA